MLVGNKCDKVQERKSARKKGRHSRAIWLRVSRNGRLRRQQNVERVFTNLVRALRQTKSIDAGPSPSIKTKKDDRPMRREGNVSSCRDFFFGIIGS